MPSTLCVLERQARHLQLCVWAVALVTVVFRPLSGLPIQGGTNFPRSGVCRAASTAPVKELWMHSDHRPGYLLRWGFDEMNALQLKSHALRC